MFVLSLRLFLVNYWLNLRQILIIKGKICIYYKNFYFIKLYTYCFLKFNRYLLSKMISSSGSNDSLPDMALLPIWNWEWEESEGKNRFNCLLTDLVMQLMISIYYLLKWVISLKNEFHWVNLRIVGFGIINASNPPINLLTAYWIKQLLSLMDFSH